MEEFQLHKIPYHLPRHSWSCAALTNREDAVIHTPDGSSSCGYCGMKFQGHGDNTDVVEHLIRDHKLGECNKAKELFTAIDFFLHLERCHGAVKGPWSYKMRNACK